jgi:hypothetical protein
VQAVEFKEEFFECSGKICLSADGEGALKMREDDPEADLLPCPKHNRDVVRVTKMMYVPAELIGLFSGKRLIPRQLMEDIHPIVVADGDLEDLKPYIQWMMACGMSGEQEKMTNPVLLPDVKAPVADAFSLNG